MVTVYITEAEMRDRFNALNIPERVRIGQVWEKVLKRWAAPPKLNFPEGSTSELVELIGPDGKAFATAHRYRDPTGKLLASGRADPKTLREGQTLYLIQPKDSGPEVAE